MYTKCTDCSRQLTENDAKYCINCGNAICEECYEAHHGYCDMCDLLKARVLF